MDLIFDRSQPDREMLADFASFADPNTPLHMTGTEGSRRLTWWRDDIERVVEIVVDADGEPVTVAEGGSTVHYNAYFASSDMADLAQLARTMLRSLSVSELFVVPRLRQSVHRGDASTELLEQLNAPSPVTKLLFLTGDAGAGKSQLLTRCARAAAEQYLESNTGALLLYVNAQGRGLARLTEALAAETQDLRSKFTYHAVARLARMGLVRVIIDGFDELIGGQGTYEDAFGSLAAFVEELAGRGALVAAARSTYFEQEFMSRVDASAALGSSLWSLEALEIAPWGETEVRDYVHQFSSSQAAEAVDEASLLEALLSEPMLALRSKPFFVAKLCELFDPASAASERFMEGLTGAVIEAYVEREVKTKLVDSTGSAYLTAAQFTELLDEVAEEMWRQETREIHARGLRELFDLFGEVAGLSETHRRLLWDQATTRAMLRSGRKPQTVMFEHELFFGHFLAAYLVAVVEEGPQRVADALSRGNVPIDAAQQFCQRAVLAEDSLRGLLETFEEAYRRTPRALSLVQQNVGTIAVELLKSIPRSERIQLKGGIIGVADTAGKVFADVDFVNVEFRRSDLRGARFEGCTFTGCLWNEIKISHETRFDGSTVDLADFSGLVFDDGDQLKTLYAPAEMLEVLREIGAASIPAAIARSVPAPHLEVVELLVRELRRANIISDDPESYPKILNHPSWPLVLKALLAHGLLVPETRSASGPKKLFYKRTFAPEQLQAGLQRAGEATASVTQFWETLERS